MAKKVNTDFIDDFESAPIEEEVEHISDGKKKSKSKGFPKDNDQKTEPVIEDEKGVDIDFFFKSVDGVKNEHLLVSALTKKRITYVAQTLRIPIADYVENILALHFKTYGKDIKKRIKKQQQEDSKELDLD